MQEVNTTTVTYPSTSRDVLTAIFREGAQMTCVVPLPIKLHPRFLIAFAAGIQGRGCVDN